jgi:hypothetical protein
MRGRCIRRRVLWREWERVEERFGRGQGYRKGRDEDGSRWFGGKVGEWALRDKLGELGRRRVGWRCERQGRWYWIREVR